MSEQGQEAGAAEAAAEMQPAGAPPEPEQKIERVLVVAAHPDDPEFICGGTTARFAREGVQVVYVVCSDGSQGGEDPAVPDAELIATRIEEQRAAARVLGVSEVVFLGHRDGYLYPTIELRTDITRQIRRFRPDAVITHAPGRLIGLPIGASHPDHIAVGEATFAAVYPDARNPRAYRQLLAEGLEAFKVRQVWYASFMDANHFVELTKEDIDKKVEAVRSHHSQFGAAGADQAREGFNWLLERLREAGKQAGYEYAEGFNRTLIER